MGGNLTNSWKLSFQRLHLERVSSCASSFSTLARMSTFCRISFSGFQMPLQEQPSQARPLQLFAATVDRQRQSQPNAIVAVLTRGSRGGSAG